MHNNLKAHNKFKLGSFKIAFFTNKPFTLYFPPNPTKMKTLECLAYSVVSLLVFTISDNLASAECCAPVRCSGNTGFLWRNTCYCADKTVSTPFCAYGSCNIFGCNCGGGCRKAVAQQAVFKSANKTGEDLEMDVAVNTNKKQQTAIIAHSKGQMDEVNVDEAFAMVMESEGNYNGSFANFTAIFKKADKDSNGRLNFNEINELAV